ncbi:MAG TPA: Smr/MutS family protein [Pseudolabrys sp.]
MNYGNGKRRRILSSEERVLWTTVIKSIAPLRESTASVEEDGAQKASSARPVAHAAKPTLDTPLLTEKKLPPLAPLGRRMKQRVARGKEMIDGRLDLHGLTQSEAHGALLRFLRAASSRGARLVLVITGKGARASEGQRGVLKRQVPQWLGLPEFRALVIGFEDAHVAHGGEGALYVRIRRKRDQ